MWFKVCLKNKLSCKKKRKYRPNEANQVWLAVPICIE